MIRDETMEGQSPGAEVEAFPLSMQQRRLWLLGGGGLRAEMVLELDGGGDVDVLAGDLEQALRRVVERHEILRTRFELLPGYKVPQQVIGPVGDGVEVARIAAGGEVPPASDTGLRAVLEAGVDGGPHRLHLSLSALAADRATLLRLGNELTAVLGGGELSPEPLQYADYADWQAELLATDDEDAALDRAFWQRQDLELLAAPGLPGCRSGGTAVRHVYRRRRLDAGTAAALESLADVRQAPPAVVPLAAWATVLARFARRRPVAVGALFAGRDIEDLRDAMGPFARAMAVTVPAAPRSSFAELVERLAASWREAAQRLIYAEGPEREGAPLPYAATYRWAGEPEPWSAGDLSVAVAELRAAEEPAPLELSCRRRGDGLELELRCDEESFDPAVAERLLDATATLLPAALAAPESRLTELPLLAGAERRELVEVYNHTALEVDGRPVHVRFAEHAAAHPESPALVAGDETLTHGELEARANRLAHHLVALGAGPETRVSLLLERSAAALVALMAVHKAGAAYVPLDPVLPRLRLVGMLADSGATLLLHRGDDDGGGTAAELLAAAGGGAAVTAVDLDAAAGDVAALPGEPPAGSVEGGHLAYVLFTSGSSGRPKGVAVEHRQLAGYVDAILHRLRLPPGASFASAATFAADLGNTAVFPALAAGGRLHLIPPSLAADPDALAEHFRRHRVDVLKIVPSHLAGLLAAAADPAALLPRRALVLGGEALGWRLVERVRELAPELRVLNHYGPTETTVGAVSGDVPAERPSGAGAPASVPLGTPLPNYRAYLLDAAGGALPAGVAGEIHLGGAGVARGYLGRPGLTAERFVPDPFSTAGGRLYRSGDLARHRPGGGLEFLGRLDQQVKIRGLRIESGEIEAALEDHPEVARAVVTVSSDGPGEPRLVAYVVPGGGAAPDDGALRHHLGERLPDYMVPRHFVLLDELPLTANGKVDRAALPAPQATERSDYAAPRDGTEEVLAALWAEVLGVERVGIHDNFFRLGGDSILSIQVIARANREGLRLNPQQIFEHQTVAELAAVVGCGPEVEAEQGRVDGEVPLTPIQRWFFQRPMERRHHFNQSLLFAAETLRPAPLARALARLVDQHDALRLRFEARRRAAGGWRQVHAADGPGVAFHQVDLSALPAMRTAAAVETASAAVQTSLALDAGPLGRSVLFAAPGGEPARLLLVLHHLVVDGVSWRILLDDLFAFYAVEAAGGVAEHRPKTTSYKTWAERLAQRAPRLAQERLGRWLELLPVGAPALPVDIPGAEGDGATATVERELDRESTRALLQEVPEAYRSEVNDALLTALAAAFAHWTGHRSLLVELEGHGREALFDDVDLSRTVGWFTSRFPVYLELPDGDAGDALKAVKERLRAVPDRGASHGVLLHLAPGAAPELAERPRPEVVFNYLGRIDAGAGGDGDGAAAPSLRPASETTGPEVAPGTPRTVPFEIVARVAGGRLGFTISYASQRYRAATVEALADGFVTALERLVAHCRGDDAGGFTPSDFPLADLDQASLDKVLGTLNRETS